MISDHDSSDESDSGGRSVGGKGSLTSVRKISTSQQRERFQATRNVPSVNVESVDYDPMASSFSSVRSAARSRSPSPTPLGGLDRESSGSTNSLVDSEFVVVGCGSSARRVTSTLSQWRSLDNGPSLDESGNWEEISLPDSSIKRSINFERSQLYLLVIRCISYPFTARYQLENTPPKQKMTEEKLGQIVRTLRSVVNGERVRHQDNIFSSGELKLCKEEKYVECLVWFVEVVLQRSDVVRICNQGSFSAKELVFIFKVRASKHLTYASPTRTLNPDDLKLWVDTFRKLTERVSRAFSSSQSPIHHLDPSAPSGDAAPNPDKLFKLFQLVLKIRNVEHQILYKECQLGNAEEQEAVVRRELQNRKKQLEDGATRVGESKFGSHKVEEIFKEEQLKNLKILNSNLDQLSLSGLPQHSPAMQRKKRGAVITEGGNFAVAKQDIQFKLKVTVTIHELTGIPSNENRPLFCAFELEGNNEHSLKTNEFHPKSGTIKFVQAGDFWTSSPVPQIKLTLLAATKGIVSSSKTLVKKTHVAMPSSSNSYVTLDMIKSEKSSDSMGKLKISTIVERPAIMKKSGFLTAHGDYWFKEKKRKFFALIQLSDYKFIFATYSAGANYPKITLLLEQQFNVEYATPEDEQFVGKKFGDSWGSMFVLVSEESEVGRIRFGCRDNTERDSWIKWLVRATGQNSEPAQTDSGPQKQSNDLDRYGLQDVVDSLKDITKIDPHKMFEQLFKATLDYRLTEETFSRGLFSPPQMYVLDEFCARYGVRDLFRHLTCLRNWLIKEREGVIIWPVMVLSSFRFCQMHIGGSKNLTRTSGFKGSWYNHARPVTLQLPQHLIPMEKSMIVTIEERELFAQMCCQLEEVLANKIQNFHSNFPYGLPKDDLKITLKLFELVATANQTAGQGGVMPPLEMLKVVMEKAALVNYKKTFSHMKITDDSVPLTMAQLSDLAQKCIEFMYELHDYYWEDFTQFTQIFSVHLDCYWLFFLVDAREAMSRDDSVISKLQLFHIVNQYFCSQPTLKLANFHQNFLKDFTVIVSVYVETLDKQLKGDLAQSLTTETWLPVGECCKAVKGMVEALHSFKGFITELGWPEKNFASQLEIKVSAICAQRLQESAAVAEQAVKSLIGGASVNFRYHIPAELLTMLNTLVHLKSQAHEVCHPHVLSSNSSSSLESVEDAPPTEQTTHTSVDDYLSEALYESLSTVIHALCQPMESVLSKLSNQDPSDGFLASLKSMLPSTIPLDSLNQFLLENLELSRKISPSVHTNFIGNWYECQLELIKKWLDQRPNFSLQDIQHQSITTLIEVLHLTYSECGLPSHQLDSDTYSIIQDRIKLETSFNEMKSVGQN